jgi:hypothetical protein
MRWAEHIARVGEIKIRTMFSLENLKGTDHLEDLDIDARISEWILEKQDRMVWLRIGTSSGLL